MRGAHGALKVSESPDGLDPQSGHPLAQLRHFRIGVDETLVRAIDRLHEIAEVTDQPCERCQAQIDCARIGWGAAHQCTLASASAVGRRVLGIGLADVLRVIEREERAEELVYGGHQVRARELRLGRPVLVFDAAEKARRALRRCPMRN